MAANKKPNPQTALLMTTGKQYMKTRYFYDGSERMEFVVQAPVGTEDGGACLVTRYSYVGATSRVESSIEYEFTWDASWDLSPDVDPDP